MNPAYLFRMGNLLVFLLVQLPVLSAQSWLPDTVVRLSFTGQQFLHQLDGTFAYWVDSTGTADFSAAQEAVFRSRDSLATDSLPPGSALWASWRFTHGEPDTARFILGLGTGDTVNVYIRQGNSWTEKLAGAALPYSQLEIPYGRQTWFYLDIPPGDTLDVLVRSRESTEASPILSPGIFSELGFSYFKAARYQTGTGFVAIFQGILLMILLYNLMVFVMTRESTYFWYAMYLLSLVAALYFDTTVRNYPGLGFDTQRLNGFFAGFWLTSTSCWYFLFGRSFLNARSLTPRWDKIMLGIISLRVFFLTSSLLCLAFSWSYEWAFTANIWLLVGEILFLLVYFVVLARKRSSIAWFFIIGSGLVFIFGFLQLIVRDWLPGNYFVIFLASVLAEILIFSLGLGYKVRKSQKDKLAAERSLNEELTKINTAFGRFVPHEFLQNLGREQATDVLLGDQVEREVTVFFSDIRSYTTLSEQMTPKENFDFLNGYLGRIGPIIQEEGGFVNQYYGDGIMALFMGKPDDALRAAVRIQQRIESYNAERETKGRMPIRLGIGLHTGPLMMGIIGDTLRMEAGVVADTVNTASRMEGLTKQYGVRILLSETTLAGLTEEFLIRNLGRVVVKGRVTPMAIAECFEGDPATDQQCKSAAKESHEAALKLFLQQAFSEAIRQWNAGLDICPDDPVMTRFRAVAHRYMETGAPPDWTGVEVMDEK